MSHIHAILPHQPKPKDLSPLYMIEANPNPLHGTAPTPLTSSLASQSRKTPHTTSSPTSPGFPLIPRGNLTAKGVDTTNAPFPLSYERTPVHHLPFPHPKWHVMPSTGEIYEVTSPILEEYDPVTGYVDSVGPVRQSVERYGRRKGGVDLWWIGGEENAWTGSVGWPESRERSSIAREAKRAREKRGSESESESDVSVSQSKRVRKRY